MIKEGPAMPTFLIDKDVAQYLESSSHLVNGCLISQAWWITAGAGRSLAPRFPLPLNQLDDTE